MTNITRKRRVPRTTYSRKPAAAAAATTTTTKRRRSSSSENNATPTSSSRSSPAPEPTSLATPNTPAPSPPPARKKSHFTFFTRASASSSSSSSSSSRRRVPQNSRLPPPQPPKPKLTQMTIDLGQTLQTTCRGCGMSYRPSTPDDEALHKRFHAKSTGGVDFTLKPPPRGDKRVVWRAGDDNDAGDAYVLSVSRTATAAEKRKAKEVMEVVDSELGAAEIELWRKEEEGGEGGERFRVYLYVLGRKCVGLCLAERIKRAYCVVDDGSQGGGGSVSVEETARPALMGVSRIWTCSSHRRRGIAVRLLDCARETFIYGMHLEKSMVAFSQPTESGGGLARGWFCGDGRGKEGGVKEGGVKEGGVKEGGVKERWAVYVEET